MPKISVIMPVYNTEEAYLREAIESILNQTYRDFEFIIIDDGSENNVEEVVKSYDDHRIVYSKNEANSGIIVTLNNGIELAKGEYIVRMDSDDISLPQRFEKQIDFMDNNPEIGVLGTSFFMFGKHEKEIHMPTSHNDIVQRIKKGDSPFAHPTVVIRKSVLGDLRYNSEFHYAEDLGLWFELINVAKFANLDEILLKYRWYGLNSSKLHTREQSLNTQKMIFLMAEKFDGLNCKNELDIIEKLKANKSILGKEFKVFISKKGELNFNKVAYKTARKSCRNLFYKIFG